MTTFLFSMLPTEVENMIVQTATTKKNKVVLNKQLNNMRRQFYQDEWYDDSEWVAENHPELTDLPIHLQNSNLEENYMKRQNENFFSNFIEPCRRRLTVGGEVDYWDYSEPTGDYFVCMFRTMNYDTPHLNPTNRWWNGEASDEYKNNETLNTYMILIEDCIFH